MLRDKFRSSLRPLADGTYFFSAISLSNNSLFFFAKILKEFGL
jgi:hypothetical protein